MQKNYNSSRLKNLNKLIIENPFLVFCFDGIGTSIITFILEYVFNLNIPKYFYFILFLNISILILLYINHKLKLVNKNTTSLNSNNLVELGYYPNFNLSELLDSAKHNIYIVGITNNGVLSPVEKFIDILEKGIDINILIESDNDLLKYMCDFYYGSKEGSKKLNHNMTQISGVISSFSALPKYNEYLNKGQINIRKLSTIISTSYIAIDITRNYEDIYEEGKIQAAFYQYKSDTRKAPCASFDKIKCTDVYYNMGKSILEMWKDSEKVNLDNYNEIISLT
ncbi:MAG: hypothetical protein IJZ89_05945 [Clostridia bacterium]|nr:hypothetical protein [Clostridia bacterium]